MSREAPGRVDEVGAPSAGEAGPGPAAGPRAAPPSGDAWRWFAPSVGYALVLGLLGVTTKVALDDMRWSGLFIWVTIAYAVVAVAFISAGVLLRRSKGMGFAAVSGLFAASGLLLLFVALEQGDAG